jgi:hypothetical protein
VANLHSIVVAFGDLGARVLERAGQPGDLAMGEAPGPDPAPAAARVVSELRARLDLPRVVAASDPADAGVPAADVLVVADLGEAAMAEQLPTFVDRVRAQVLAELSHLFGAHNPRFSLTALLALTGARDAARAPALRAALAALDGLLRHDGSYEPLGRMFLVEEQSGRYLIGPRERVAAVASLVGLLRTTEGRRMGGVGEPPDPRGPFVGFAAATLEVPVADLRRYTEVRATGALLEGLRQSSALGLSERQARMQPHLLDRAALDQRLGLRDGAVDLERIVREAQPRPDIPSFGLETTPETIRDVLFGWDWYARQESEIRRFSDELESFQMPALVAEVDEQGTRLARELPEALRKAVDGWVWSGPRGWAEARECLADLRARTAKVGKEIAAEIREEELPEFPSFSAFEERFCALRAETEHRPRPARLWFIGALATLGATALLHPVPKWVWVRFLSGDAPLLSRFWTDPMEVELPTALSVLLDRPWVIGWLLLVIGAAMGWRLRRMFLDRHEALSTIRDEMAYRLRDVVSGERGSVLEYYLARLRFSYRLWQSRLLQRMLDAQDAEIERLDTVRLSLDQMQLAAREEERRLAPESDDPTADSDVLYRTVRTATLFQSSWARVAETPEALTHAFFAHLLHLLDRGTTDWRDAPPFADPERIDAFVRSRLAAREAPAPLSDAAPEPVRAALQSLLSDVGEKLAPALETHRERIGLETRRVLLVPPGTRGLVGACVDAIRARGADAFAAGLEVMEGATASDRVHLVVLEPGIPLRALKVPPPPPTVG